MHGDGDRQHAGQGRDGRDEHAALPAEARDEDPARRPQPLPGAVDGVVVVVGQDADEGVHERLGHVVGEAQRGQVAVLDRAA